jgi:hypothetical protein
MTNNISIFLEDNPLASGYIWSFEGDVIINKDISQSNNNYNLEDPTTKPTLDSNTVTTLSKPIDKNMPLIKQFFGIFYIKDLIYVKSYFQPCTLPSLVDYNIITQSPP